MTQAAPLARLLRGLIFTVPAEVDRSHHSYVTERMHEGCGAIYGKYKEERQQRGSLGRFLTLRCNEQPAQQLEASRSMPVYLGLRTEAASLGNFNSECYDAENAGAAAAAFVTVMRAFLALQQGTWRDGPIARRACCIRCNVSSTPVAAMQRSHSKSSKLPPFCVDASPAEKYRKRGALAALQGQWHSLSARTCARDDVAGGVAQGCSRAVPLALPYHGGANAVPRSPAGAIRQQIRQPGPFNRGGCAVRWTHCNCFNSISILYAYTLAKRKNCNCLNW